MAKLKIITGKDNAILKAMSKPIHKFDSSLKKFAKQMKEAMIGANGLGIAAPQVGKNVRLFLVILDIKEPKERMVFMANPVITEFGKHTEMGEEGCLSLPGQYGQVRRSYKITVEFLDLDGHRHILKLEGLNARVVQHELDHLDGILFLDRMKEGDKIDDLLM